MIVYQKKTMEHTHFQNIRMVQVFVPNEISSKIGPDIKKQRDYRKLQIMYNATERCAFS